MTITRINDLRTSAGKADASAFCGHTRQRVVDGRGSLLAMLAFLALASEVFAQSTPERPRVWNQQGTPSAPVLAPGLDLRYRFPVARGRGTTQAAMPPSSRDTIKNGIIIGAVVGASILGGVGALICNLEQEPGAGDCLSDTLRVAAIGAGIGAAAGLAIDAALTRRTGITVRFRITF